MGADTDDVAAAKVDFQSAFAQAEAGEHIALAPVNNDVHAEQIAAAYMADTEDVAAAKAQFMAAFEDAEAGVQAAAPIVAEVAAPEVEEVAAPEAPVVNALPMHYLLPYAPAYTYSMLLVHHLGAYALPYAYPLPLAPVMGAVNEEASEPAVESA